MSRPSSSVKNAQEWLKQYHTNEETIDFLEDRNLRDQLYKKKEKTEKFIGVATTAKETLPPDEPLASPGEQETQKIKDEMVIQQHEAL